MNFFEQEMRKILEVGEVIQNPKYIGKACIGTVGKDIKARLEFVTQGSSSEYEGIKATILDRTQGPVGSSVFLFQDVIGMKKSDNARGSKKVKPVILSCEKTAEWSECQLDEADYQKLSDRLNDYMQVFCQNTKQSDELLQMKMM